MPNPNAQFSPNLQNRYTNTQRSRHTKFDGGMIRDIASWELPEGAVYDAQDCLCDYVGKIRKRGGTTSPAAGNSAASVENVVNFKSSGIDAITAVIGSSGKSGAVTRFTTSNGALTTISSALSAPVYACRPFQHRNMIVLSMQMLAATANDSNRFWLWGGGTGSAVATAGAVTAGDNRITGLTGAGLTSAHLGSFLYAGDGSGTTRYFGRIVEVTTGTSVRVEPVPTVTIVLGVSNVFSVAEPSIMNIGLDKGNGDVTGRLGISFQGRILLGDVATTRDNGRADNTINGVRRYPRRLQWGLLSSESPSQPGGLVFNGDNVLMPGLFTNTDANADPTFNYQDIDSLQSMTGLAAIGDGQVVIFGPQQMFRLSGQLSTETVANNAFSYSVDQVSNNVGCVSAKSIQYARGGLIWAGYDNIYEYDGSSLKPMLNGRNQRYFQDRLRAGDTIYGSAYNGNRNHYYLSMSGTDGGLMFNLDTLAMTRFTNVQLFDSTPDPADATKLWGVRWWDTTGAAPTMTKGQLIGLESIWLPTSANKTDADGTAVLADVQTAAYVNGALPANKMTVDCNLTYDLRGSGSPTATVKADTKLNTSDASYATITASLPDTGSQALSKSLSLGSLLPEGQAIEMRFTQNASANSLELLGLDFGTQGRPEEFST